MGFYPARTQLWRLRFEKKHIPFFSKDIRIKIYRFGNDARDHLLQLFYFISERSKVQRN